MSFAADRVKHVTCFMFACKSDYEFRRGSCQTRHVSFAADYEFRRGSCQSKQSKTR